MTGDQLQAVCLLLQGIAIILIGLALIRHIRSKDHR